MRILNSISLFVLLSAAAFGSAQSKQDEKRNETKSPTYTLRSNVREVVLDVVVTDRKGHVVSGLGRDSFTVYENRVPQTTKSFSPSAVSLPPKNLSINSTAELDQKAPNSPVNIIVLDEIATRFEDEAFARYSLKRFLDAEATTQIPTMLVAVDLDHLMVLQDFTTSKAAVLSALQRHLISYPWKAASGSWQAQQLGAALNSLMEVAQATRGHTGRKTVIWLGRGFPAIDPSALTADQSEALHSVIESCTNALRDARVVLYTLDPAGITTDATPIDANGFFESDPFGGQLDFEEMAQATGGKVFEGRNDIDRMIDASATEGTSFYTMSYVPTDGGDQQKPFRNIHVVMKDPNLTATTRLGYYTEIPTAPTAAKADNDGFSKQMLHDLAIAGDGILVYDAVPFTVGRDKARPDDFELRLRSSDFVWQTEPNDKLSAEVSLFIEVFDRKGKRLSEQARVQTLEVAAVKGESVPKKDVIVLPETVATKPPGARIRFVVRVDATGKIGTNNFFLVDEKTLTDPTIGLKGNRP